MTNKSSLLVFPLLLFAKKNFNLVCPRLPFLHAGKRVLPYRLTLEVL